MCPPRRGLCPRPGAPDEARPRGDGLYAFVVAWNDYQYALILTSSERAKTIQLSLSELLTFFGQTNWGGIMASGVLTTLPVVLIFMLIQRLLVQGITAGALKS